MFGGSRSIALGLLLASLVACDSEGAPEPSAGDETGETGDESVQGISPGSMRWVLDWKPVDGVEVVNDLGYRVRVDAGWIGSWGVTLVPCTSANQAGAGLEPDPPGAEPGIASPWLIAEGHPAGTDDPFAWVFAVVESLTESLVVESEVLELAGERYCQAHHLLAPISDASEGFAEAEAALALLDPEASLVDVSVVLFGTWEPPGGGEATPFVLRSEQAYGKILELEHDGVDNLDDTAIEVVLSRELAHMFDEIDFATAEPKDAGWQLLANLATYTSAQARAAK